MFTDLKFFNSFQIKKKICEHSAHINCKTNIIW